MSDKTNVCLSCFVDLGPPEEHCFVNFRYQVPGTDGEQILCATVCKKCAEESDSPNMFPAIEAIINARIIRIEFPEKEFTP